MKKYFVLFLIILNSPTWADGIMSVTGQFISCDDAICKIKVDHAQIYHVKLKKLNQLQARELQLKKPGEFVSTSLPMAAVASVNDVKNK